MLQKWNKAAMKTHSDASKIFSFDDFKECKETIRRTANKMKKLESNSEVLFRIPGKNKTNKKLNNTV
jgi:hypothetical protein